MKKLLLGLLAVSLFAGCDKEIEELPEPTETGANTFGAKINGELWGPMKLQGIINTKVLEARYYGDGTLLITASNYASSPKESEMEIYLYNVKDTGTYIVNDNTVHYPRPAANFMYFEERKLTPTETWITNSKYTGTVTISKLDTQNKIVAGTFSFDAISVGMDPKTLKVTDGRFDLKYE